MSPKLFLSGGIYFWKWRQAACSRWKFTCFYGTLSETAFPSFNFHPTASCQFVLHTHAQKQTCTPQPKKNPNLEYLYSYSPSVHLSCCFCCDPVLFCFSHFMGLRPKLPLQAQYMVPHQLWRGVSEKTQWHLSARREWVGRNIAENKIEQQKEQQN